MMETEYELGSDRIIAHLDMDAFFAAVEERDHPNLRGKPVVVGADPAGGYGRGVVSTANYAARAYGIRSGLPITRAWRLSQDAERRGLPPAEFVRGSFGVYGEVSDSIMNIIGLFAKDIQQVSVDEAYVDVSFTGSFAEAARLCGTIKHMILAEEQLTASVGIGPNKLVAKIASDFHKPDGLTVVPYEAVMDFLRPLAIRSIPGVGPKTEVRLRAMGVNTIEDAGRFSEDELRAAFGQWGGALYRKVRGIDYGVLHDDRPAKSVGRQTTFRYDTRSFTEVMEKIEYLCDDVFGRLKRHGFAQARTVVVTVRLADFTTLTRSYAPRILVGKRADIFHHAIRLLLPFFDARENPRRQAIRLVGVRLEGLR